MTDVCPGGTFGKWVVLELHSKVPKHGTKWLCRCECGKELAIYGWTLKKMKATTACRSCAAKGNVSRRSHNESGNRSRAATPEYRSWVSMRDRCANPKNKRWDRYGGRGIRVCKEWGEYTAFLADMGRRPTAAHSLDRIDPSGDYEPGNCRWATAKQQARNRTSNRLITALGETHCLLAWQERTGIPNQTIQERIDRGWSPDDAVTKPPRKMTPRQVRR